MRQRFQEESLDYVCKLQEIQERKKFECVEPVSDRPRPLYMPWNISMSCCTDGRNPKPNKTNICGCYRPCFCVLLTQVMGAAILEIVPVLSESAWGSMQRLPIINVRTQKVLVFLYATVTLSLLLSVSDNIIEDFRQRPFCLTVRLFLIQYGCSTKTSTCQDALKIQITKTVIGVALIRGQSFKDKKKCLSGFPHGKFNLT